jgi:hypothetical protein
MRRTLSESDAQNLLQVAVESSVLLDLRYEIKEKRLLFFYFFL